MLGTLGVINWNQEITKTVSMYQSVLSGKSTNSGDKILVYAGIGGVLGLMFLPKPYNWLSLLVPVGIYSLASQI